MIGTNGLLALGSLVATLATATPFELGARQDSGGGAPGVTLARPTTNNWVLNASFVGEQFYEGWEWETMNDPTEGRVNYVDMETAKANGLSWVDTNGSAPLFGMAGDSKTKIDSTNKNIRGRDSVRIKTKQAWVDAVIVAEVSHMPTGCGTWPAFWTLGEGVWPEAGEIDIIEGTNNMTGNMFSVHTGMHSNCLMPANRSTTPGMEFTGKEKTNKCDGGAGCNVLDAPFGAALNSIGGGWFVTRRDARGVSMWYWPHSAGDVPDVIKNPTDNLDETLLGKKIADFPTNPSCEKFDEMLAAQKLIFNLTFCGGWGTAGYNGGPCKKALDMECPAYVDAHPEAFKEAYWLVNGVRVYTPASK